MRGEVFLRSEISEGGTSPKVDAPLWRKGYLAEMLRVRSRLGGHWTEALES